MEALYEGIPSFKKDEKIFADAVFNQQVDVLLTADEKHLANDRFRNRLESIGLDKKIKVFTPKEIFNIFKTLPNAGFAAHFVGSNASHFAKPRMLNEVQ